ncbi:MAG: trypsin-like peptidase domain-containing protein [Betaproteobacteria bacterium]|jgi:TPR repeat protein
MKRFVYSLLPLSLLLFGCGKQSPSTAIQNDNLEFLRTASPLTPKANLIKERALQGDNDLLYSAVGSYLSGYITSSINESAAINFLEKGFSLGEWRAGYQLISYREKNNYVPQDLLGGFRSLLDEAAKKRDPQALYTLGVMYASGKYGYLKDLERACGYFRDASSAGSPIGHFAAASCLEKKGASRQEIHDLYEKAAAGGVEGAAIKLIESYIETDFARTENIAQRLLTSTNPNSGYYFLMASEKFCPLMWTSACKRPGFAAILKQRGEYESKCTVCTEKRIGIAKSLLERSAELGDGSSAALLASYYKEAEGEFSLINYTKWILRGVELGDASSMRNLAELYASGEGGYAKDPATAVTWYRKAAIAGDYEGQWKLALRLWKGSGIQPDLVEAYAWMNIAGSSSIADGMSSGETVKSMREQIGRQLTASELAEAQKLSSGWKIGAALKKSVFDGNSQPSKTGTYIYVSDGTIMTNEHVVRGCKSLRLPEFPKKDLQVRVTDQVNDLALISVSDMSGGSKPVFARSPESVKQGEEILVYGYPLSQVLARSGNLTPGIVSAMTGINNNSSQFQITAPIQPGSSGSPVIDRNGKIVGMVSQKLNDVAVARATGSIPQGVNFAISGTVIRSFLDTNKVAYDTAWPISFEKNKVKVADEAKLWTGIIECLQQ